MGTNRTQSEEDITVPRKYAVLGVMLLLALIGYIVYR